MNPLDNNYRVSRNRPWPGHDDEDPRLEESIKALNDTQLEETNKKLQEVNSEYVNIKNKIDELYGALEETKRENKKSLEDSRMKATETLGIFAAIFTFISIDFQAFKSDKPSQVIALVLIFGGILINFALLLDYIIRDKEQQHWGKFLAISAAGTLSIAAGIWIITTWPK